jgi:hypothetical protein
MESVKFYVIFCCCEDSAAGMQICFSSRVRARKEHIGNARCLSFDIGFLPMCECLYGKTAALLQALLEILRFSGYEYFIAAGCKKLVQLWKCNFTPFGS